MEDYGKNKESSYLKYWNINNLYGWTISQKLDASRFKWVEDFSEFNEDFIKGYNEKSNERYFLEVDVQYPENLHEPHNGLPKINGFNKVRKLATNLRDKKRIRNLKQALNHGSVLKKIHKAIKFNQKPWLKSYIDTNTKLRKKGKNDFKKGFFKLMKNLVFGKTKKDLRKHRDINLVATEKRRNYLFSEPNNHRTKFFHKFY